MKRALVLLAASLLLSACTDEEARDQASAAEERAASAAVRAAELEMKLDEREARVSSLELNQAL